MAVNDAYVAPFDVVAFNGVVVVSSPFGPGVASLTPASALASAELMVAAAHKAMQVDTGTLDDEP